MILAGALGEPQVAEQRQRQPDAGGGAVDGGDDGRAVAVVPREVVVELGLHAVARVGPIDREPGVVRPALGVGGEGIAVAADAERRRRAGDHDRPHVAVGLELGQDPAVLGVHPAGPRVVPVRAVQPHRGDVAVDLEPGRLQLHRRSVARIATSAPQRGQHRRRVLAAGTRGSRGATDRVRCRRAATRRCG